MTKHPPLIITVTFGIICFTLGGLCVRLGLEFSPPGPVAEVAPTEAPALSNFSSPSSEVASDKSATFTFDELLDALMMEESGGDPWAVGDNGNAVGAYQIHKIYVDDVNRILGWPKHYDYSERYSCPRSRQMVKYYLNYYGGTFEEMARKHNGGPNGHKKDSTKAYWLRVKARMEKVK